MEGWQPTVDLLGEDGHVTRRTTGALVAALAATLLVSGCGSALKAAKVDAKAEASATATQSTPGPPPPAPKVGKCYDLTYKESLQGTSKADPVPCKDKHTSVTIYVGEFDPIVDGHLLAVDSDEVQAQIAKVCPSKVGDWVGGSKDDQRLSRFKATWFSPTLAASDAGADWFRCDLVAKRGDEVVRRDHRAPRGRSTTPPRSTPTAPAAPPIPATRRSPSRRWPAPSRTPGGRSRWWTSTKDAGYLGPPAQNVGGRGVQGPGAAAGDRPAEDQVGVPVAQPGGVRRRPALRAVLGAGQGLSAAP